MSHIVFYEKPGCGGNARQKAALRAGHTLEVRDLLRTAWTPDTLRPFLHGQPVPDWFNRAAPRIRQGLLDPDALSADEALACLLTEPLLIRRPLMQCGPRHHLGFVTEAVHAWVGLGPSLATLPGSTGLEGCAHPHAHANVHTHADTNPHTDSTTPPPSPGAGRCASPPPRAA